MYIRCLQGYTKNISDCPEKQNCMSEGWKGGIIFCYLIFCDLKILYHVHVLPTLIYTLCYRSVINVTMTLRQIFSLWDLISPSTQQGS